MRVINRKNILIFHSSFRNKVINKKKNIMIFKMFILIRYFVQFDSVIFNIFLILPNYPRLDLVKQKLGNGKNGETLN